MFQSFPKGMKAYLDKLPPDSPLRGTRTTKNGDIVETIKNFPNTNYKAPKLTALGRKLLGTDPWIVPGDKRPVPENDDTESDSDDDDDKAPLPETNDTEDESEGDGECAAMHACTAPGVPIPH